jgi:hypothetical protein
MARVRGIDECDVRGLPIHPLVSSTMLPGNAARLVLTEKSTSAANATDNRRQDANIEIHRTERPCSRRLSYLAPLTAGQMAEARRNDAETVRRIREWLCGRRAAQPRAEQMGREAEPPCRVTVRKHLRRTLS